MHVTRLIRHFPPAVVLDVSSLKLHLPHCMPSAADSYSGLHVIRRTSLTSYMFSLLVLFVTVWILALVGRRSLVAGLRATRVFVPASPVQEKVESGRTTEANDDCKKSDAVSPDDDTQPVKIQEKVRIRDPEHVVKPEVKPPRDFISALAFNLGLGWPNVARTPTLDRSKLSLTVTPASPSPSPKDGSSFATQQQEHFPCVPPSPTAHSSRWSIGGRSYRVSVRPPSPTPSRSPSTPPTLSPRPPVRSPASPQFGPASTERGAGPDAGNGEPESEELIVSAADVFPRIRIGPPPARRPSLTLKVVPPPAPSFTPAPGPPAASPQRLAVPPITPSPPQSPQRYTLEQSAAQQARYLPPPMRQCMVSPGAGSPTLSAPSLQSGFSSSPSPTSPSSSSEGSPPSTPSVASSQRRGVGMGGVGMSRSVTAPVGNALGGYAGQGKPISMAKLIMGRYSRRPRPQRSQSAGSPSALRNV